MERNKNYLGDQNYLAQPKMPDTQLQIELAEARREIQRLRERLSVGAPTVHKDLSLVSQVPKFSDSESEVPLQEFISTIENSARMGNWNEAYKIDVAFFIKQELTIPKAIVLGIAEEVAESVVDKLTLEAMTTRVSPKHYVSRKGTNCYTTSC